MKRKTRLFRAGMLATLMALGAMTGDWCVNSAFALFNDVLPCKFVWSGGAAAGNRWTQNYAQYKCTNGAVTLVTSGSCTVVTDPGCACAGVCGATCTDSTGTTVYAAACSNLGAGFTLNSYVGQPPLGFNYTDSSARTSDGCDCSPGDCSGSCTWVRQGLGPFYWSNTNDTCGNCDCTDHPPSVAPTASDGTIVTNCYGVAACSGNCNYTSVSSGPGTFHWVLSTKTCTPGQSNCGCPGSPDQAPCPEQYGDSYSVGCGWPEGNCKPKVSDPPPCDGNCQYVASRNSEGLLIWSLASNNCTAGAANCSCPSSPGGNCPTSEASETSLACGSAGGPCDRGPCTGDCNYRSVSTGDGNFTWQLDPNHPNTCKKGVDNCGCPSEPGGDCPRDALATKTVSCGSASTPCKKKICDAHGGDEDNDGCCADVDFDDNDAAVCSSDCKGTYTLCEACTATDPNDSTKLVACDKGTDGCRCSKCDPNANPPVDFCRCRTVNNGDKDKDNCCDAVDKYPDDPKRGCECCEWADVWNSNGGPEYAAEFNRVFGSPSGSGAAGGGNGPMEQFVTYNSSTKTWTTNTPSGTPAAVVVPVPFSRLTYGRMSDTSFAIPVTVAQLESAMSSLGAGDMTGQFAGLETWRSWWRLACTWLCGFTLLKYLFQELRV